MNIQEIPFEQVHQLSHFDQLYATDQNTFSSLIPFEATWQGMEASIRQRVNQPAQRELLSGVLHRQYLENGIAGKESLINSLLNPESFTIVTAHQPYLLGGPLYFVSKILSTIKLAAQSKQRFPQYHFVPVFYIGGEDHDLEECNHTTLFGKSITWETNQTGPVGRMGLHDIDGVLGQASEILGAGEHAQHVAALLRQSYQSHRNVNQALTHFIHALLADYEFLILNADDYEAKQAFKHIIREEVLHGTAESLVLAGQEQLQALGLKPQAFVRPVNFFYLSAEGRNRIDVNGDRFEIHNTDLGFSRSEMEAEIDNHPERFSPNVIMRPVYQEFLCPSIAFVGGGGEIAYWSDRKTLFEHHQQHFPVLVRRDSNLIIDPGSYKRMRKLNVRIADLFLEPHLLKNHFLESHSESTFSLDNERIDLGNLIKQLQEKAANIDRTLMGFVGSETSHFFKSLEHIESRLKKSIAQKHQVELQQLTSLQQKLFPNGGLQERTESFLSFYVTQGPAIFDKMYDLADPLSFTFKVLVPEIN